MNSPAHGWTRGNTSFGGLANTLRILPKKTEKRGVTAPATMDPISPRTIIHHSGAFFLSSTDRGATGISLSHSSWSFLDVTRSRALESAGLTPWLRWCVRDGAGVVSSSDEPEAPLLCRLEPRVEPERASLALRVLRVEPVRTNL